MKTVILFFMLISIFCPNDAFSKSLETYVTDAQSAQNSGNIDNAVQTIEAALEEYPDNPTLLGYLGGYVGTQAGNAFAAGNLNDAGELTARSFDYLDKAIGIDSDNVIALFNRGIMSVNVPDFFGKLTQGILDLEKLDDLTGEEGSDTPDYIRYAALDALGTGYAKQGMQKKAFDVWQKIIELEPGTPFADQADNKLKSFITSDKRQSETLRKLSKTNPEIGKLTAKLKNDPDNPDLLCKLAREYGKEADKGYDQRVYDDTTFLTNIAFEAVNLLDKAARLAPDNMEIMLESASVSVMMPFFVNRLDRGMKDLEKVIDSDAPDALKAEARFWLGYAYRKKATTEWIKVISGYPKSEAAEMAFEHMAPHVSQFDRSKHKGAVAVVEILLGFRDELAPQTAVWIEDSKGNFVKTLYVSGFSGYAREKQVNLPKWSKSSTYTDADAVTAASIDLGRHQYIWDLKDSSGMVVDTGKYTVRAETSYWPSMKYQAVSTTLAVGDKDSSGKVEKGRFIPYLGVTYYR